MNETALELLQRVGPSAKTLVDEVIADLYPNDPLAAVALVLVMQEIVVQLAEQSAPNEEELRDFRMSVMALREAVPQVLIIKPGNKERISN